MLEKIIYLLFFQMYESFAELRGSGGKLLMDYSRHFEHSEGIVARIHYAFHSRILGIFQELERGCFSTISATPFLPIHLADFTGELDRMHTHWVLGIFQLCLKRSTLDLRSKSYHCHGQSVAIFLCNWPKLTDKLASK